ncbi:MAG: hypothetical protein ABIR37_04535 [Candidatus Saccharimonadales bacterium]
MASIYFWQWVTDFLGVNNGDNSFSTHMYNFWSGFGGNVSILALAGVLVALYRHYHKYLHSINPVNIMKAPLDKFVNKNKDE